MTAMVAMFIIGHAAQAKKKSSGPQYPPQLPTVAHARMHKIKRAGLTPWPKLFQNLRSTRETELAETFPLHVMT